VLSIVSDRIYTDYDDDQRVWTLEGDSVIIERSDRGDLNGASGSFYVDRGDAEVFRKFNDSLSDYSSGMKTPLLDEIRLSFTVGLRQPLKAFGKRNENLSGGMVDDKDKMKVVQVERLVLAPIDPKYRPME